MAIRFTPDDWARIARDYSAWWQGPLDRPLVYLPNVFERPRRLRDDFPHFLAQFPPEVPPEEIVRRFVACQEDRCFHGDTFPFLFVNFGAGILAAFLGAKVNVRPETVWFAPPDGADLATLRPRLDEENPWWRRVCEITRVAAEAIGQIVQVSISDLGGNLDVLASLVGTETLLAELLDRPAAVDQAVHAITREWLRAYDKLHALIQPHCPGTVPWAPVWAPGRGYMFQSDFSYMISPEMFERFVRPDLAACCERIEYSFYHLDGVGEIPHLDCLLGIEKLRGIQWIPGDGKPPAGEWPDLLRRIRDGGKLCQVFLSAEGARRICRELGGKGFLLAVWDRMTPQQAEEFVEEIQSLSH